MVLWNFDLQLKNYSTMEKKTMVLYRNYRTTIYEGKKKHGRLPKTIKTFTYNGKYYGNIP